VSGHSQGLGPDLKFVRSGFRVRI